ncbi:hypothetical protein AAG906_001737 [Vitis piasezkii]
MLRTLAIISNQIVLSFGVFDNLCIVHGKAKLCSALPTHFVFSFIFISSKSNSEDVFPEDEWLGFLFLGVKEARPTLGKASDLRPLRCTSLPLASLWEEKKQVTRTPFLYEKSEPSDLKLQETLFFVSKFSYYFCCACHVEYEIVEEAMNFMSYVAEVSRGWDEPNARDLGRMKSQPNAKGEMYILNDDIDMKAKIAAMARRLEELEMKKMQKVQAISQTPLQPMPCSVCRSFEHLVDQCPTIPVVREMFGDCNTYNSNWRNHPNFSWKPQPPLYKQHVQALLQASNLEQAMINLSKVVGDFVGAQKSINAQLSQRIDSVESSLNKRMDEVQNDLSQKIDNLQYSISRFANLNMVQEKESFPSQPYQNSKGIHQVEAQKGESSMVKEVKPIITLRSGKEADLPTCKLEHKEEKGEPQRIVIKEEMMKKHMPPPFPQALYGKIIQTKSQVRDANFIWDPGKLNQDKIF